MRKRKKSPQTPCFNKNKAKIKKFKAHKPLTLTKIRLKFKKLFKINLTQDIILNDYKA